MSKQKHFDLNLLRIFIAVYKHQSITKAAEELDLTQSSVSNAIKRLQDKTVGKPLFIRSGGGIVPSSVANSFYAQVESSMLNIDDALSSLDDFDPTQHHHQFVVSAFDSLIQQIIGKSERTVAGTNIAIRYQEIPHRQELIREYLITDQVDLILDVKPPTSKSFSYEHFVTDRLVCIVRADHPRIGDTLSKSQFLNEKHILLNFQSEDKSALELFIDEPMPERKVLSEQTSMMSMFASVSQTDAVAVTLERYSSQYAERFGLKVLSLPYKTKPIDYYMIWNSKFNHNPAHQWLRSAIASLT